MRESAGDTMNVPMIINRAPTPITIARGLVSASAHAKAENAAPAAPKRNMVVPTTVRVFSELEED